MRTPFRALLCALLTVCALVACLGPVSQEWPSLTSVPLQHYHTDVACPAYFAGRPNGLWLATICGYQNVLYAVDPDGSSVIRASFPRQLTAISSATSGGVWVATNTEVFAVDRTGRIRVHVRAPAGGWVSDIAGAPDGSAWFVQADRNELGHVETSGKLRSYKLADAPESVAVERSGRVLVMFDDRIAEWTPSGPRTLAAVMGQIDLTGRYLVPAPDGSVWVVGLCGTVGHMNTRGQVHLITLPRSSSCPVALAPDAFGGAWFVDNSRPVLAHISPAGDVTAFSAGRGDLEGVAVDDRGRVWFSNTSYSEIDSFTPAR